MHLFKRQFEESFLHHLNLRLRLILLLKYQLLHSQTHLDISEFQITSFQNLNSMIETRLHF